MEHLRRIHFCLLPLCLLRWKPRQSVSIAVLGHALVLYVVVETGQEQCIALESRSSHGRNSLLLVENGGEGVMVGYEHEPPPIEVHMEPFNTSHN